MAGGVYKGVTVVVTWIVVGVIVVPVSESGGELNWAPRRRRSSSSWIASPMNLISIC